VIYAVIEENDESRFKIGYTTSPNDAVDIACQSHRTANSPSQPLRMAEDL
jgi:hypothetical protein